ncbi:unnamed protein product [Chilo suppressalis]|uniref:Delta-like protein n=1 Tax=Chilo suppressalis TaxID=168631 RepID=A0ABN8B379_CHISP|nr:hypothetical protein evm_001934 [Chilo suppressalis]CAH0402347.1 unnamed protein product [Chilo suppressalis]
MRAPAVLIALIGFLPQVLTSGSFELRIKSFTNSLGRLSSGQCCDGSSSSSDAPCLAPCRTKFRVCLKIYQANIDTTSPCTFGDITTPVLGGNSLDVPNLNVQGFSNPIVFPFDFTWPGTFSLIVEAWHDTNETSRSDDTLIARMTKQSIADVGGPWVEEEQRWGGPGEAHLRLSYRVTCAAHYYGAGCEVLCRPRDDAFGHYTCSPSGEIVCKPGWTGDYCSKPRCLPGCDAEHGHCLKPDECICHTGWVGELCDQCQRHPGCFHGTCTKPWDCNCDEGWGGLFCNQDLNYCTNHRPCRNGGTCHNTGQGSYTCVCPPEYTGLNCEKSLHSCAVRPCLNGGACVQEGKELVCACPSGFDGAQCETRILTCADQPCRNGGTCETRPSGYVCTCPPGFAGTDCALEADPCAGNPCRNGATCSRAGDSYKCSCKPGFKGNRCEVDIDDCAGVVCEHGGTCVDLVNDRRCQCAPGFVGARCETRVDFCKAKPCANGGKCLVLDNDYECRCQPGFEGKDCSIDIDECASSPCQNGGTCRDRVDGYHCDCSAGWGGKACTVLLADFVSKPAGGHLRRVGEDVEEESLSGQHVALIAALSAAVPALALAAAVGVACVRRRRKRAQNAADAEARAQNAANAGGGGRVIRNTWGKCDAPAPECQNAHNAAAEECKRKTLNTESAARLLAALDPRLSRLSSDSAYCANSDTSLVKRALEGGGVYVLDDHCLPPTFATQV